MTTNDLLLALLKDIVAFANIPDDQLRANRHDPYLNGMLTTGIPYRPKRWLPPPLSPAVRMACSRAARLLEQQKMAQRVTEPKRNRVTHLIPTPVGLAVGMTGTRGIIDGNAVLKGLQRTLWARECLATIETDVEDDDQADTTLAPFDLPPDGNDD
jgi:hypothetical protein